MAEQDDKSAALVRTGEQSPIGAGCAPGEERDSAIGICAVHSPAVTAAIAEFCGRPTTSPLADTPNPVQGELFQKTAKKWGF